MRLRELQQNLIEAIENEDIGQALVAIENGANPNTTDLIGTSTLHLVAKKGSIEDATELLAKKVDVSLLDDFQVTPLWYACMYGQEDIALALLPLTKSSTIGTTFNGFGETTALQLAIKRGLTTVVTEFLIKTDPLCLAEATEMYLQYLEYEKRAAQAPKESVIALTVLAIADAIKIEEEGEEVRIRTREEEIHVSPDLRNLMTSIKQIAEDRVRFIQGNLPRILDPNSTDANAIRNTASTVARFMATHGQADLLTEALDDETYCFREALPVIARGLLEVCSLEHLAQALSRSETLSPRAISDFEMRVLRLMATTPEVTDMVLRELANHRIADIPDTIEEAQASAQTVIRDVSQDWLPIISELRKYGRATYVVYSGAPKVPLDLEKTEEGAMVREAASAGKVNEWPLALEQPAAIATAATASALLDLAPVKPIKLLG